MPNIYFEPDEVAAGQVPMSFVNTGPLRKATAAMFPVHESILPKVRRFGQSSLLRDNTAVIYLVSELTTISDAHFQIIIQQKLANI
jgi:hypothetical protein